MRSNATANLLDRPARRAGDGRPVHENRRHRRHLLPFPYRLTVTGASFLGLGRPRPVSVRGRIQDVSGGGLRLLTDRPLKPAQLVRCEIRLREVPVWIPTLMQVRWTKRNARGLKYAVGLQFLS